MRGICPLMTSLALSTRSQRFAVLIRRHLERRAEVAVELVAAAVADSLRNCISRQLAAAQQVLADLQSFPMQLFADTAIERAAECSFEFST